jgi:hypothetical protein
MGRRRKHELAARPSSLIWIKQRRLPHWVNSAIWTVGQPLLVCPEKRTFDPSFAFWKTIGKFATMGAPNSRQEQR